MMKKLLAIIVLVMVASLSIAGCTSSTNSNQAASTAPQAVSSVTQNEPGHDPLLAAITAQIQKDDSNHTPTITWSSSQDRAYGMSYDENGNIHQYSVVTVNESWVGSDGVLRSILATFNNEGSVQNATTDFKLNTYYANCETNGAADDGHESHYAQAEVAAALGHTPITVNDITWHYSGDSVAQHEYIQYDNIFVIMSQNLGINDPSAPVTRMPTPNLQLPEVP